MDYNVAIDKGGIVNNDYMEAHGVTSIPHAFVIDIFGKIVWNGHPAEPEFENVLARQVLEIMGESVKFMTDKELHALPAKDLKKILALKKIDQSDCLEKQDFIDKIKEHIIGNK